MTLRILATSVLLIFSAIGCEESANTPADSATECQTGFIRCGANCVDVENDSLHCGACDTTCSGESFCSSGSCNDGCGACGDNEVCVQSFDGACLTSGLVSCVAAPSCSTGCSNNIACSDEACGGLQFSCANGPTCNTPARPGVDIQCEGS